MADITLDPDDDPEPSSSGASASVFSASAAPIGAWAWAEPAVKDASWDADVAQVCLLFVVVLKVLPIYLAPPRAPLYVFFTPPTVA
jgi:hypothetical protein